MYGDRSGHGKIIPFTSVKSRCLRFIRDNKEYRRAVFDLDMGPYITVLDTSPRIWTWPSVLG